MDFFRVVSPGSVSIVRHTHFERPLSTVGWLIASSASVARGVQRGSSNRTLVYGHPAATPRKRYNRFWELLDQQSRALLLMGFVGFGGDRARVAHRRTC